VTGSTRLNESTKKRIFQLLFPKTNMCYWQVLVLLSLFFLSYRITSLTHRLFTKTVLVCTYYPHLADRSGKSIISLPCLISDYRLAGNVHHLTACSKRWSLHMSHGGPSAGAYPGFCSMKRLPPALNLSVPIYTLGRKEALCLRT